MNIPFFSQIYLAALLAAAAVTDLRSRRIPNLIILLLLIPSLFSGPAFLLRLTIVCLILFPLFLLKVMGGGDIKLLGALCAVLGMELFFRFALLSFFAASIPAAVLLLRGKRGSGIPMSPFFLIGYAGLLLLCRFVPQAAGIAA